MAGTTTCALVEPEYSEHTAGVLAELCRHRKRIAVLSAPSVCSGLDGALRRRAAVFDFDPKWVGDGAWPCFTRRAAQPHEVEQEKDWIGQCDLVIAHVQWDDELILDRYMQMVRFLAAPDGLVAVTSAIEHEVYLAMCGLFLQRFVPGFGEGHDWAAQWRLFTNFDHELPGSEDDKDFSDDESEVTESTVLPSRRLSKDLGFSWSFACEGFEGGGEPDFIDEAEVTHEAEVLVWQGEKPRGSRRLSWSTAEMSTL